MLADWFSEREVTASIFYTADETRVEVDPLTEADLVELIAEEHGAETGVAE